MALGDGCADRRQIHAGIRIRIMREVALGAVEQGARAVDITTAVVVERDGDLDQALEEFLFFHGGGAPGVFPDFMGVEILARVEEREAALEA